MSDDPASLQEWESAEPSDGSEHCARCGRFCRQTPNTSGVGGSWMVWRYKDKTFCSPLERFEWLISRWQEPGDDDGG